MLNAALAVLQNHQENAILLGLAGVAWLVAVKLFLVFFDRYLFRN